MILNNYNIIKIAKVSGKKRYLKINHMKCDVCKNEWDEPNAKTLKKQKHRNEHLCTKCLRPIIQEQLIVNGTKALKSLTPDQRTLISSNAGKISQKVGKCKKGWFTRERWNSLTPEQQKLQITKANNAAVAKLKAMTTEQKTAHYVKVMKGCMGFVSKGQQELLDSVKHLGFIGNYQISEMNVDLCNPELKIVIEYNGDVYHCNPKHWNEDEYSNLIKMTAGEKWKKDATRYEMLNKMGYQVIVVWESDWIMNKLQEINRIIDLTESDK